jgi:hypothetical protein
MSANSGNGACIDRAGALPEKSTRTGIVRRTTVHKDKTTISGASNIVDDAILIHDQICVNCRLDPKQWYQLTL